MTRGFVKLPRSFFLCPLWTDGRRRTNIEAYFDLLQRQAFHNTSLPLPSGHVDLKSGQLFVSCRKLADEWGWQGRQVKDFLEVLRDLGIAKLEEMQAGYRITLFEPIPDASKNILVNSSSSRESSQESSEEKKSTKSSENPAPNSYREPEWMADVRALHAEYPGVFESVEFIEFKERKRLKECRPGFSPAALRGLIEEFLAEQQAAEEAIRRGEDATSENPESPAETLQESGN
ncbi:MAG: hypothetical protein IPG71_13760 [bacterium]|nr:hypothetical protein [bacterium]